MPETTAVKKYTLSVPIHLQQEAKSNAAKQGKYYADYLIEALQEKIERDKKKK